MADRTNDERLREIASSDPLALAICAQMGEPSWADVRAIAAELRAARARIAKLEQEPPMAMIDLGVGVNWKGLSEDRQRLRAEHDLARAEVERMRAMLAGLCGAVEHSAPRYGVDEDWRDVDILRERMIEAKALLAKHKETNQ